MLPTAAALAALLLAQSQPPSPVLDDWRSVGPFNGGEGAPKGVLSDRAAAALVAALDAARGGPPVVPTPTKADRVVENLRRLFRPATDPAGPAGLAAPEVLQEQSALARRITILGLQPLGAFRLLVVDANVVYSEPGGGFVPARIGLLVDGAGRVRDAATLSWSDGDACFSMGRDWRVKGSSLRITEAFHSEGLLCAPGDPDLSDCCTFSEGEEFDLAPSPDGRLREAGRRRINLSGQFLDAATGEQLLVEDLESRVPRVGYRARVGAEWKRLAVVRFDRGAQTVLVRFASSPTTYTLTLDGKPAPDTRLLSKGSDGSKVQTFRMMPPEERYR